MTALQPLSAAPREALRRVRAVLAAIASDLLLLKHLVDPLPRCVTQVEGGEGFAEIMDAILDARRD